MTRLSLKRWLIPFFIILLLLTLLACSALTVGFPTATSSTASPSDEVTLQQNLTFGSGSFNLSAPQTGLSNLSSYAATLTISFDGTKNGQPDQWSKKYTMLVSQNPAARQLTIDTTGGANPTSVFMAEMDGASYEVKGQNGCTASAIESGNALSDRLEPASFLHYVIGADDAGSESINGVAANHYKFDERALGQQNLTQSSGEVWAASDGGYVVKYSLTQKGKSDYFGSGIEGTLTWDYELTDVGKPVTIQLPADCPMGMVNVPQLPDASNVVNTPGVLTYNTSTSIADAAAFYQKQIPTLGWKLQGQADITDTEALLDYRQNDQEMSIFIVTNAGVTVVNILLERVHK